jgi:hypothetical protein
VGLQSAVFGLGGATRLALADKSVDLVVSVRFLNHLELDIVRSVIVELARVSRRFLIVHVRVARPAAEAFSIVAVAGALRNLVGRLGRLASRVFKKKKVADKAAIIHPEAAIHEIFGSAGLQILENRTVRQQPHQGFDARMYILCFASAHQP